MATEKRLIDANALLKVLKHRVKGNEDSGIVLGTNSTLGIMEEWVRSIPTVDAVEVVRCNDCLWFKPAHFKADDGTEIPWDETFNWDDRSDGIYHGGKCKHDRNTAYGQKDMAFRKPDDFCSYGERKDHGTV